MTASASQPLQRPLFGQDGGELPTEKPHSMTYAAYYAEIGRLTRPLLEQWWRAHPERTTCYPATWTLEAWAAGRIAELETQVAGQEVADLEVVELAAALGVTVREQEA